MKMLKLILHNDRGVLINLDRVLYATPITIEETGQELLRVVFSDGKELDVIDKFHEFNEKVAELTN